MVFGHNTNLNLGTVKIHVQTEDRGASHALIDTTVYHNGLLLHRRTNSYLDLLPLNADRQQALKLRLDDQHHTVIEEIRSGLLQLALPPQAQKAAEPRAAVSPPKEEKPAQSPPVVSQPKKEIPAASEPRKLALELINAKSWISGKNAVLQVRVRTESGEPVAGARVDAQIEGSDNPQLHSAMTGTEGQVQIEFAMPRITGSEAALVIRAEDTAGQGHLRFALRSRTRVPSV